VSAPETLALRFACGASAALRITSGGKTTGYVVTAILEPETGARLGWRLENCDNGRSYDLPADLSACECKDSLYRDRPGGCKHRVALSAALAAAGL
jgi:hypothetical protein